MKDIKFSERDQLWDEAGGGHYSRLFALPSSVVLLMYTEVSLDRRQCDKQRSAISSRTPHVSA